MEQKILQVDTRQKKKHHERKEAYFQSQGYRLVNAKCLVGDYQIPNRTNISVDTKASIGELYSNLIQDHERFRAECQLAQDCGIKLVILVENDQNIRSIEAVKHWKNPRMFAYYKKRKACLHRGLEPPKPPASNVQLVKIMWSMTKKYGVEFQFCSPEEAGRRVLEILEGNDESGADRC